MNIKVQAGLDIAKFMAFGAAVGALTMLALTYIPLNIIATALAFGTLITLIGIMYDIRVAQLRYKEKLKEMTGK